MNLLSYFQLQVRSLEGEIQLKQISSPNDYNVWNASNVILSPASISESTRLVVFLSGTGASPRKYMRLLRSAQSAGNFVIGLSYLSQPFPVSQSNTWCVQKSILNSTNCNKEMHEHVLFGDSSLEVRGGSYNVWNVGTEYSVCAVLGKVLHTIKWGNKFLKYGNGSEESYIIDWNKIIISGHSQGAGHAAYLSFKKNIPAVLFSGPQDCSSCSQPWLRQMSNQNITRRAMFHVHEECGPEPLDPQSYCEENLMMDNLSIMGMEDPLFYWYNNSSIPQRIQTVISVSPPTCSQGRKYHNAIALDNCASENIEPIWEALFTFLDV